MKCPHCLKPSKAPVMETRQVGDDIYRRRVCGVCARPFVSKEFTSPDLRIPRKRAAAKTARATDRARFTQTAHLQEVWRR